MFCVVGPCSCLAALCACQSRCDGITTNDALLQEGVPLSALRAHLTEQAAVLPLLSSREQRKFTSLVARAEEWEAETQSKIDAVTPPSPATSLGDAEEDAAKLRPEEVCGVLLPLFLMFSASA